MSETDITLFNLYEYVKYDYEVENKVLHVRWDCTNKILDKFMTNERGCHIYQSTNEKKYSCLWIDQLKHYISWEMGNKIPFQFKTTCNGEFRVIIMEDVDERFIYEEIGEDGYLYIAPFDKLWGSELEKCNCVYNDLLDELESYILK